jgi:hypothetical protein
MRANLAPLGLMLLALLGAIAVPAAAEDASGNETTDTNETTSTNETSSTNETGETNESSDTNETSEEDGATPGRNTRRDAAQERRDAAQERRAELQAARAAALEAFHENRTAAIEEFRAAHNATKASFLENKTRVLAECAALRNATTSDDENATGASDHSKCVRDGLKPLIEQARAEHKEQRETFQERMREARQGALGQWMKESRAVNERHAAARGGA